MKGVSKAIVGVSNGQMPGNKSTFPPAYQHKSRLHYYSTLFDTIEINSSFYKTPLHKTCAKWAAEVHEDFRFTLKLNRDITHCPNLHYNEETLERFMQTVDGIGNKKGCLLIQFPGKITLEFFGQVEKILRQIRDYDSKPHWRRAVEFRNESWYIRETTELLNEYQSAMVLHDYYRAKISTLSDNAAFSYLRLHGPSGNYRDSYEAEALDKQALFINELVKAGRDVYAYFNNTAGNAFQNALYLKSQTAL